MFFHLSKLLISGFPHFKGDFVAVENAITELFQCVFQEDNIKTSFSPKTWAELKEWITPFRKPGCSKGG